MGWDLRKCRLAKEADVAEDRFSDFCTRVVDISRRFRQPILTPIFAPYGRPPLVFRAVFVRMRLVKNNNTSTCVLQHNDRCKPSHSRHDEQYSGNQDADKYRRTPSEAPIGFKLCKTDDLPQ